MTALQSYRRVDLEEAYDAIVIGSGIGGLSAAALLARHANRRVLVLERHYTLGGFTHAFRRPGYEWDVGVHYIGDVRPGTMLRALYDDISDEALQWADMGEVYDRVFLGDLQVGFPKGRKRLRRRLKEQFPQETKAIDTYFELLERTGRRARYYFMEKAVPAPIAAVAGPFLRWPFLRQARHTTLEVLESLTRNRQLIGVLTAQWGDYGLPPGKSSFGIHAIVAGHYLEGGFYPVGGAARIAETILPVISQAGGLAVVGAQVKEVVVERNRAAGVRMEADGRVLRAPLIISDAGVFNTYGRLLPQDVAQGLDAYHQMHALEPSMAHLSLYVGLNETAESLDLPRNNLWIYPDEDHDRTFKAIQEGDLERSFVYISFPSAKDPDFERRHPGRSTIDVITAAPYEAFRGWEETRWKKRGDEYEDVKERHAERLLDVLYQHLPQTRGKVETWEVSTPLSTRHFCNYEKGEIYGLAHTTRRFEQRWLKPRTRLPGLFLTGQDVATCGVSGALMGGVLCASAILGKNLLEEVARAHNARPELGLSS